MYPQAWRWAIAIAAFVVTVLGCTQQALSSSKQPKRDVSRPSEPPDRASANHDGLAAKNGSNLVLICHKPNVRGGVNIAVPERQVRDHLAHGDRLGPCPRPHPGNWPHDDEVLPPPPLSDADADGVSDDRDQCPNTPAGQVVDVSGCSCTQLDADQDGVNNCIDRCPGTAGGAVIDGLGCSCDQRDQDADSINDCSDQCPDTVAGYVVEASGCSCDQLDSDVDGISDCEDQCDATPPSEAPDETGCSCSQRDADNDRVDDCSDQCPQTPVGDLVDGAGCSVLILACDAGADQTAIEGEAVALIASAIILQGSADPSTFVYSWVQLNGPAVTMTTQGAQCTFDSDRAAGDLVFEVTVASADGDAVATDTVMVHILAARLTSLAAGRYHNAALTEVSRLRLWGYNRTNQLGDGSLSADVISVDAGQDYTFLAKTDGTAWLMGQTILGTSAAPFQVIGISDVAEVGALFDAGMMLKRDGTVWGFGPAENRFCQLGGSINSGAIGTTGPVMISGLPGNIVRIASAGYHTIALGADGRAWVWGGQRFGCTPFVALDRVIDVAAGEENLCLFIRDDGSVWGMGFNFYGQLGNGTTVSNYRVPTRVLNVSNVVAVAAGNRHSYFLDARGNLWSAGWNHDCELGLGSGFGASTALPTVVGLSNVRMIAAGYAHGVAVVGDHEVYVWGLNSVGQLSSGTNTSLSSPVCVPTRISP